MLQLITKVFYFIWRTFATYEEGVEVDAEKQHQQKIVLDKYQSRLKAECESIPIIGFVEQVEGSRKY